MVRESGTSYQQVSVPGLVPLSNLCFWVQPDSLICENAEFTATVTNTVISQKQDHFHRMGSRRCPTIREYTLKIFCALARQPLTIFSPA